MLGGNGVDDEVEAAGVLRHSVGVAGYDGFIGAETQRVPFLLGEVVKTTTWAPNARANFTPIRPSPPRPITPTFRPLVTPSGAWASTL